MRRKDREITEFSEIETLIREARVCRLGFCAGDQPYVAPFNFGYADRTVYIHCAKEGRKLEMIAQNPNVCFEIDLAHQMVVSERACGYGFKYKSVIGFGRARVLTDPAQVEAGLAVIMAHQAGGGRFEFAPADVARVYVIKVDLAEITGKRSGY